MGAEACSINQVVHVDRGTHGDQSVVDRHQLTLVVNTHSLSKLECAWPISYSKLLFLEQARAYTWERVDVSDGHAHIRRRCTALKLLAVVAPVVALI